MIKPEDFERTKLVFTRIFNNPLCIYSLLSVFTLIFTFPALYPIITRGLDSSYVLAINHLVATDFGAFRDLIFTFGPLGFLKYPLPLGSNLEIAIIWIIIVRLTFIGMIFYIGHLLNKSKIFIFLLAIVFANILQVDQNIYGIIIFSLILHRMKGNHAFLASAIFLTMAGLFIKINIGFIGFLFCASYLLYDLIVHKNYKRSLTIIGISLFAFIVLFTLLLGNPLNIFSYYANIYPLVTGNSSALSIYPDNNWLYLFIMFLIFFAMPILDRNKDLHFILFIIALAVFAIFKYSFARQENVHAKHFLDFLFLFALVILLYPKKIKIITVLLVFTQIILYYLNLNYTGTYTMPDKIQLTGVINFKESICEFSTFKAENLKSSDKALRESILPPSFTDEIGSSSIDFFAIELTYFYINDLNYKPRPTLQSGCLYIPPLIDQINADHMYADDAPEYMIWTSSSKDGLPGIDGRYLLNSDGEYLNAFLGTYTKVQEDDKRSLWKHTDSTRLGTGTLIKEEAVGYDQWVEVPLVQRQILKLKFDLGRTFAGLVKSALFKEGEFFIHYQLANGQEIKHKFSRDNGQTGLWIQPYIRHINNQLLGDTVSRIKITHTHRDMFYKDNNDVKWYSYKINP